MTAPANRRLATTVILSAALGALAAWGVMLATGATPPIGAGAARDYVLAHPEMLPEVIDTLRQRESGRVVAENRAAIFTPYGNAWAGNPRADLTIVEYFDYNCGYCRASLPIIAKLLAADPGLRIVFREWPILSVESEDAARASLAAAAQGKFAAFHAALYGAGPVSAESIAAAASATGVNLAHAAPDAEAEIARNMRVARALGLNGTPGWIIGDRAIAAAMPLETLQKAIAEARAGQRR